MSQQVLPSRPLSTCEHQAEGRSKEKKAKRPLPFLPTFFAAIATYWHTRPLSFTPGQYSILAPDAEGQAAWLHAAKEFLPRRWAAKRAIDQQDPSAPMQPTLHKLRALTQMEEGIQRWQKAHPTAPMQTAHTIYLLYCRLLQKAPLSPLSAAHSLSSSSPSSAGENALEIALYTLFSHPELIKRVVFAPQQRIALKEAFLLWRAASAARSPLPASWATTLRPLLEEIGAPTPAAFLAYFIQRAGKNKALFSSLHRYATCQTSLPMLAHPNSSPQVPQGQQEAFVYLNVLPKGCFSLEDTLISSFGLKTSPVHTRYASAPPFLFFHLGLADPSLQIKEPTIVGVQRLFYLAQGLTLDGQGAAYRLSSFNALEREGYVHYREEKGSFFRLVGGVSEKISELTYLYAAQTASTVLLRKIKGCTDDATLCSGYLANRNKLEAMLLIFQGLDALRGAFCPPKKEEEATLAPLVAFIAASADQRPIEHALKKVPSAFQSLLLDIWSENQDISHLPAVLEKRKKIPLSLPKIYPEELFEANFSCLPAMVDLLAEYLYKHPEKAPLLRSMWEQVIIAIGRTAKEEAIPKYQSDSRNAALFNAIFREVGQCAVTCGAIAARYYFTNKTLIPFEKLTKKEALQEQLISSAVQSFFAGLDPLHQNPLISLARQTVLPARSLYRHYRQQKTWDLSPLIPTAIHSLLAQTPLSLPARAVVGNVSSLAVTDIFLPAGRKFETAAYFQSLALHRLLHPTEESVANRLSTLHDVVSQIAAPYLHAHSDTARIHTSCKGWGARTLHILLTNTTLKEVFAVAGAGALCPKPVAPPLPPSEKKRLATIDATYEDYLDRKKKVEVAAANVQYRDEEFSRKCYKNKYHGKLVAAIEEYNAAIAARDAAVNRYYELIGSDKRVSTKPLKIPKRAKWFTKTALWANKHLNLGESALGCVSIQFLRWGSKVEPHLAITVQILTFTIGVFDGIFNKGSKREKQKTLYSSSSFKQRTISDPKRITKEQPQLPTHKKMEVQPFTPALPPPKFQPTDPLFNRLLPGGNRQGGNAFYRKAPLKPLEWDHARGNWSSQSFVPSTTPTQRNGGRYPHPAMHPNRPTRTAPSSVTLISPSSTPSLPYAQPTDEAPLTVGQTWVQGIKEDSRNLGRSGVRKLVGAVDITKRVAVEAWQGSSQTDIDFLVGLVKKAAEVSFGLIELVVVQAADSLESNEIQDAILLQGYLQPGIKNRKQYIERFTSAPPTDRGKPDLTYQVVKRKMLIDFPRCVIPTLDPNRPLGPLALKVQTFFDGVETVGKKFTPFVQAINPGYNPESAAAKAGEVVVYIIPSIKAIGRLKGIRASQALSGGKGARALAKAARKKRALLTKKALQKNPLAPTYQGKMLGRVTPGSQLSIEMAIKRAQQRAFLCHRKAVFAGRAAQGPLAAKQLLREGRLASTLATDIHFSSQQPAWLRQTGKLEVGSYRNLKHLGLSERQSELLFRRAEVFLERYKGYRPEMEARSLIHRTGLPTFPRPKGIPTNYRVRLSNKPGGMLYMHPDHTHSSIRVMPGKIHSEFPYQRKPYVIYKNNGKTMDKYGNIVRKEAPEAHIFIGDFVYRGE